LESNWRTWVYDWGMWGSRWRLAARQLPPNEGFAIVATDEFGPNRYAIYELLPEALPEFIISRPFGGLFPHFPYGWEVEED